MSVTTIATAREYLGITQIDTAQDALLQSMLNAVEANVERICGIGLTNAARSETHDGGGRALKPYVYPVTSIESVYDNVDDDTWATSEYALAARRYIRTTDNSRWEEEIGRWDIGYHGGYSSVPAGLLTAILMLLGYCWENRQSLLSKSVAGNFFSFDLGHFEKILAPWRETAV